MYFSKSNSYDATNYSQFLLTIGLIYPYEVKREMQAENKAKQTVPQQEDTAADAATSTPPPLWQEQRRHKRVELEIGVRFMLSDKTEYTGILSNVSAGGLSVLTEAQPEMGSLVIFYIDELGRFEGKVRRVVDSGFAAEFANSDSKRDRTADVLTWVLNKDLVSEDNQRKHPRSLLVKNASLQLSDGTKVPCQIMDMSLGGVFVKISDKPPMGEVIRIGQMEGRVVRHTAAGVGIEFMNVDLPQRGLNKKLF